MEATYILPLRRDQPDEQLNELTSYLRWLAERVEVVVVDGSPTDIFAIHNASWSSFVVHVSPDSNVQAANGKVRGVLSGLRRATHECVVIADEDVRYDDVALTRLVALLEHAHVVRPQNYFEPLPWHALLDTGRTLLNRVTGGDWPGTLGVRRSVLQATNGYDGDVLFENLELVRTVRAVGGTEKVALNLFVRRRPASTRHFWSQRVRQAYDEFARPLRFAVSLALLPLALGLVMYRRWTTLAIGMLAIIGLAEVGRRRGGGERIFPFAASLLAPAWVGERALCIWFALGARLFLKGVPYRGSVLARAATSMRTLQQRHAGLLLGNSNVSLVSSSK